MILSKNRYRAINTITGIVALCIDCIEVYRWTHFNCSKMHIYYLIDIHIYVILQEIVSQTRDLKAGILYLDY